MSAVCSSLLTTEVPSIPSVDYMFFMVQSKTIKLLVLLAIGDNSLSADFGKVDDLVQIDRIVVLSTVVLR